MIEKHISSILDEKNQEELMRIVIDTFEKQLSKHPRLGLDERYACAECGSIVIESFSYCPCCGQKIDWR